MDRLSRSVVKQCSQRRGKMIEIEAEDKPLWCIFLHLTRFDNIMQKIMKVPYKISVLLYCFDEEDRILLLHRNREPNKGLWSPCGGKLKTEIGESPYGCAVRELREETGMSVDFKDLHLAGIVSEESYEGSTHWLMFLFEVKKKFSALPSPHSEGIFCFFEKKDLETISVPETDRKYIWPLFFKYRNGFFAVHSGVNEKNEIDWILEEGRSQ